ncbi:MAG: Carboxyl-terminal protease [Candidatus Curtissbacteria bacterium GW2011_GWA2_41_24]|uniref:Carboxyl-terminal protease n=1 Tax=Candidatus Curtissbacteria bacterium GW2011_GWA2_41_24 TaxID=1618411 RepID=A0A0G0VVL4_9BACT|nr:MAG: Carboxyl-terminal protease [Candidatus Curtissbacteria bacterium GW2011_GWA2_41_24]
MQFLVIAVIFFAIGFAVGQRRIEVVKRGFVPQITVTNQLPPKNQNIDFSLFWQVFETLPQKYIDKSAFEGQKLLYGAISGMVRSLGDPYTAFLDPKQNEAIKADLSGVYEGVGIQIGFNKDKRLVVIAPLSGTPAQKANVRAKDLILRIDERDTFDLTLPEAVDLIRGPAGTSVKLELLHEGQEKPQELEIERAKISVKSVEVEFKNEQKGEIAVIKVTRFGDQTDSEWDMAVSDILARKVMGVVVDMRNNPGGLLSSAVHLASDFIRGTVVRQEFADGNVEPLAADHEGKLLKIPLTVLVNAGSASASEIFAGAIQDANRAKIVGEKTFGKGTVQDVVDFAGGSGLHITIAKWLTPRGKSISAVGITPDFIIEFPQQDQEEQKEDPQLDKALEIISK